MSWHDVVSTAASLCAVLGFCALAVRWLHQWAGRVESAVETVETRTEELTPGAPPHGKSSLRDDVAEILAGLVDHRDEMVTVRDRVEAVQTQLGDLTEEVRAHIRSPLAHACSCYACAATAAATAALVGDHSLLPHPVPPPLAALLGQLPEEHNPHRR